jgi:hypothetical protein
MQVAVGGDVVNHIKRLLLHLQAVINYAAPRRRQK